MLLIGSIFSGYILEELLVGLGNNYLSQSVLSLPNNLYHFGLNNNGHLKIYIIYFYFTYYKI
jgi:hypothetical protein